MIICICHRVSDRDIARAVQGGCASFDELQFELFVATSCGKCHDCARETFQHQSVLAGTAHQPTDCGAQFKHGQPMPIVVQHRHEPMAPAIL